MEHYLINAFAEQQAENSMKLAIARDLQRIWSDVLQEPLPIDLSRLIYRLEKVTGGKSAPGRSRILRGFLGRESDGSAVRPERASPRVNGGRKASKLRSR